MKRYRRPLVGALLMTVVLLLTARCSAEAECESAGGHLVDGPDNSVECVRP